MTALRNDLPKSVQDDLRQAADAARSALAKHADLLALDRDLKARAEAINNDIAAAEAAAGIADAQSILAPEADRAEWVRKAIIEAEKAVAAKRELARITTMKAQISTMLTAADAAIEAAHANLFAATNTSFIAARDRLAAEAGVVVAQLRRVLELGLAYKQAGVPVGAFVTETKIPNPRSTRPFVTGSMMTLLDDPVFLDQSWRDNPEAVRAFDFHVSYTALLRESQRHIARIGEERGRALAEQNRVNRANSFAHPPRPTTDPQPVPEQPPAPRFVPNADTRTPPSEARNQDGMVRIDIDMDRTERLTPAEMDALWRQASGGLAPPAIDPELREIIGRVPPWRGAGLIERDARSAANKVRFAVTNLVPPRIPANPSGEAPDAGGVSAAEPADITDAAE